MQDQDVLSGQINLRLSLGKDRSAEWPDECKENSKGQPPKDVLQQETDHGPTISEIGGDFQKTSLDPSRAWKLRKSLSSQGVPGALRLPDCIRSNSKPNPHCSFYGKSGVPVISANAGVQYFVDSGRPRLKAGVARNDDTTSKGEFP